jgi:outer membrane protein assembly factor BamA
VGEVITDVRVLDNQRTEEDTIRSIAGVKIGDTLELDTLEAVRERLNSSGLFADTNVWWEQAGAGVRINIAVKDKFPWAPVPTASWSANNRAIGILFVHGNLFGRGKQMVIGGRLADLDSGAVLAYRDPASFGSWIYWQLQGSYKREILPEYNPVVPKPDNPIRQTTLTTFAVEPQIGVAWLRRVKTQVAWRLSKVEVGDNASVDAAGQPTQLATRGAVVGMGRAGVTFDFRAREFAVMTGSALSGGIDVASPGFKSDLTFWRIGASYEQGVKFFRSQNFIYNVGGTIGGNLPLWMENTAGGPDLRGYLTQQFRGDSQLTAKVEYHFPLFSIGSMDFRALGFYDATAIWFRSLPDMYPAGDAFGYRIRDTPDQRTFPEQVKQGLDLSRDIHTDVGAGLRFFLRSVAVPLVGFDAGYGIEARKWRFLLIVGA